MPITRRALLQSTSLLLTGTLPRLAWAQATSAALPAPPVAPVRPVSDDIFGSKVTDPYRWLEAPGSAEFETYLRAQGAYTRAVLSRVPGRDALAAANAHYTGGLAATRAPQVAGPYLFLQVRPAGADTYKLQVRLRSGGAPRILVDPDAAGDGKKRALNYWALSPDGSHVVFGISESGSEDTIMQVIETATGRVLPERIDRTQYASPGWRPDGKGFYYNRLAGTHKSSIDYYKRSTCRYHATGTDPAQDVKVLEQGQFPNVAVADIEFPGASVAPDSTTALAYLIAGVQPEFTVFSAPVASVGTPQVSWTPVFKPADKITGITQRGDELFLITYVGAPRYRVIKTSASRPDLAGAATVVPESDMVIDNAIAARDAVYLIGKKAGTGELRRLRNDGRIETIALPYPGSLGDGFADPREDGLWFTLEGWTVPPQVCHVAADGKVTVTDLAPKPSYDTSLYTSELVYATARDGAQMPLSIVYRKGLKRDGSAPTIIKAYGSYGIANDPAFSPRYFAWLDAGGIFATAHVRGGGELGRAWYEAGKKATKPNTWRDLIACAEKMIADRWTSTPKLAIEGTSAGGITVGRALTERPDLFAVVLDRVGVSNPARTEFSPNGPPNIPEFGSVADPETASALIEMDALYHVKDGTAYPSVMLTTGLNDPRVSPWEPGKMAARLRAATSSGNPVLLRIEEQAGHGVGSTRSQFDQEYADLFAFAFWRMGDPRYQPGSG